MTTNAGAGQAAVSDFDAALSPGGGEPLRAASGPLSALRSTRGRKGGAGPNLQAVLGDLRGLEGIGPSARRRGFEVEAGASSWLARGRPHRGRGRSPRQCPRPRRSHAPARHGQRLAISASSMTKLSVTSELSPRAPREPAPRARSRGPR